MSEILLSCYRKFEYLPIKDKNEKIVHYDIKIDDNFLNKEFSTKDECDKFIRQNFITDSKSKNLRFDFIENMYRLELMKKIDKIVKNAKNKIEPYFVVYDRKSYELVALGVLNAK